MNRANLQTLTVDQLVERFAAIGVEQDKAEKADDNAKYNRRFHEMSEVQKELKIRQGDQRRALVKLFDYPNMQVRLMAARYALAVAPQAARRVVEAIAAST
jgi:hypothetical protein